MTHPLIPVVIEELQRHAGSPHHEDTAEAILLALLRHPAMREPSQEMQQCMYEAGACPADEWPAGCDALAQEVESSR